MRECVCNAWEEIGGEGRGWIVKGCEGMGADEALGEIFCKKKKKKNKNRLAIKEDLKLD